MGTCQAPISVCHVICWLQVDCDRWAAFMPLCWCVPLTMAAMLLRHGLIVHASTRAILGQNPRVWPCTGESFTFATASRTTSSPFARYSRSVAPTLSQSPAPPPVVGELSHLFEGTTRRGKPRGLSALSAPPAMFSAGVQGKLRFQLVVAIRTGTLGPRRHLDKS